MTSPETPSSRSSSGNVWKWIGIGCAGFLVLGVGAIAALVFVVQRTLNMSFDSGQAETAARSIVDYEIPGGSQGFMSMDMGMMQFAGVMSTTDAGTILVVGRMSEQAMQGGDPAALEKAAQEGMQQNGTSFTVENQRTEARQLCGQPIQLTILEGRQSTPGQAAEAAITYQAFTIHEGEGIFVSLTTTGAEALTKADAIFNSLKCQ